MSIQVEAVYEGGVFRPLQAVDLPEHQRVIVTVPSDMADLAHFTLSPERWVAFCEALDAPPREIPALRKLLTEKGVFDDDGRSAL